MRHFFIIPVIACLTAASLAQQPSTQQPSTQQPAAQQPMMPATFGTGQQPGESSADFKLRAMWEPKIKAEWEALKSKDKKAYGELLADDYQGVELDGRGERNRVQALNELTATNIFSYTLWGLKAISLGPEAAFVIYESTMQFPPKSQFRYSRVYIGELWIRQAGQWKELHYQETNVK